MDATTVRHYVPSMARRVALFLWGLSAVGIALGSGLAVLSWVRPLTGFFLFVAGAGVGVLCLPAGLVAVRRSKGPARRLAWAATAHGAAVLALLALGLAGARGKPRINDITTDPEHPPALVAAAHAPDNAGRDLSYPAGNAELQRAAYPDLKPIDLPLTPKDAAERARQAAERLGWRVVSHSPSSLEATDTSKVFHFVDDIVVRVRPSRDGSVVDVRSKSRDGKGDLGVNAARIRAFRQALESRGG